MAASKEAVLIAETYSKLYGKKVEEVYSMWEESQNWEDVENLLSREKFGILDHEVTELVNKGYDFEDIKEAEALGLLSGSNAKEIIKERGKWGNRKSWAKVRKALGLKKYIE